MLNNSYRDSDLQKVKHHIDSYDLTLSELVNTVDDYGKPIFVFNNFGGSAMSDMLKSLNKWRAMHSDNDSNIDIKQIAIDAEARIKTLEELRDSIFRDGMGVDGSKIVGGVTNYQIASMYMNLNMKANRFEQMCTSFIKQLAQFYIIEKGSKIDPEDIFDMPLEITYVRKPVEDTLELMRISNQSVGSITDETRFGFDPRVSDPVKEAKEYQGDMIAKAPVEEEEHD
jgi:SPP1 family phage portal protein